MQKYYISIKSDFKGGNRENNTTIGTSFGYNKLEALKRFLDDPRNDINNIDDDFVINIDHISKVNDIEIINILKEYYYLRDRRALDEQKY